MEEQNSADGQAAMPDPEALLGEVATAASLREAGQVDRAEAICRAVLKQNPAHFLANMERGRCLRLLGQHPAALACFLAARAAQPDDLWGRLESAAELRETGRHDEAEAIYRDILEGQPDQLQARMELGRTARLRGDRAGALASFEAARAAHPRDLWARLEVAFELRALGRTAESEKIYGAILQEHPGQLQAAMELGRCARQRGDRATARACFQAAAAAHPQDIWARLELAGELRHDGSPQEAETLYRAVLADAPGQLQALIGVACLARERGDRPAAERGFREAAAAHPDETLPRLELATEFRDRGDFAQALALGEGVLKQEPANVTAWLHVAHTHDVAGDTDKAIGCLRDAVAHCPPNPWLELQLVRRQRLAGRIEESESLLGDILLRRPADGDAWTEKADAARQMQVFEEAEPLYRKALSLQPGSLAAVLGLAQLKFDRGDYAAALGLLEEHFPRPQSIPEVAAVRIFLLLKRGELPAARDLARAASRAAPGNFMLALQEARTETLCGNLDTAERMLPALPVRNTQDQAGVLQLRGQLAELRWKIPEAIACYAQAQRLQPKNPGLCLDLARCRLLDVDPGQAHRALEQYCVLLAPELALHGRSPLRASQSILGQLVNEYTVQADALEALHAAWGLPPEERPAALLGFVREWPEYTPGASAWLMALRQAGRGGKPEVRPREGWPIPRGIVQFWHSVPPDDVREVMQSWATCNPGFAYRLFDDAGARDFLERCDPSVLQAYRIAREPAQKADIFRLAWLFLCGGYYADADDRCLAAIAQAVPADAGLVLFQDDVGSIGNNFIGAIPGHPVIGRALEQAVQAVIRGDHEMRRLSTGAGALTRALAEDAAGSPLGMAEYMAGIRILGLGEMRRISAADCICSYKNVRRFRRKSAYASRNGRLSSGRAG